MKTRVDYIGTKFNAFGFDGKKRVDECGKPLFNTVAVGYAAEVDGYKLKFQTHEGNAIVTTEVGLSPRAFTALTNLLLNERYRPAHEKYSNILEEELKQILKDSEENKDGSYVFL